MKVAVQILGVILLVQVALAAKGPVAEPVCDAICPNTYPVEDNLHLPYTNDCTKFCHCANDGNWKKDCPAGLHFNAALQVCDRAEAAGCVNDDAPTTGAPSTGCENVACGANDCFNVANTANCQNYCDCDHGEIIINQCADGLYFNDRTGNCDWAQNVECDAQITAAPTTASPSKPIGICDSVCPAVFPVIDNMHLPYPDDCNKFCHCANDGNWEKICPAGLHFNAAKQVCDTKANAGCHPSAKPTTADPTDVPITSSPSTAAPTTALPGKPSDICDSICPAVFPVTENNHLPFPGDCNRFCHCANDGNWEKICSAGLHFNAAKQVCDWKENAACDGSAKPTDNPITSAPSSAAPSTVAPSTSAPATNQPGSGTGICNDVCPNVFPITNNNHLAIPGDCTKFCHCANDGNWEKDCPSGLHFNAVLQVCDWVQNAGCAEGTTDKPAAPSSTAAPSAASSTAAPSGSDGTCLNVCPNVLPVIDNNHLPYPGNCSKFCHCANDGNWVKDCPSGLHFNAALEVCDWPSNAGCRAN